MLTDDLEEASCCTLTRMVRETFGVSAEIILVTAQAYGKSVKGPG